MEEGGGAMAVIVVIMGPIQTRVVVVLNRVRRGWDWGLKDGEGNYKEGKVKIRQ